MKNLGGNMTRRMMTMDGNTAAAYISYAFSEVATIYPITPSSVMPELVDQWASEGKKNIFGEPVKVSEMQSEAGAAGALHGSLVSGALTTTYTASQGLLLMIPNMYKIAGENLPGVFHVSARALASHALSIFGDHQDVMGARATGFAMLATGSVQEVMDLAPIAHLASLEGKVPFLHFFDGFRTSHEIQKIEVLEYEELADMLNEEALEDFRKSSLNPENPKQMGTAQNPDIYFQSVEASNTYYENIIGVTEKYMNKINEVTGKDYGLFNYYGHEEATKVIVAMGSVTETIKETIDYLNAKGEKIGLVKVRLIRPFSKEHFRSVLPETVEKIAVLDRTKEKGSLGEPLYLDVKAALYGLDKTPEIIGGIYGLGSKDTTPSDIKSVYDHLDEEELKEHFTISINDDVTHRSLKVEEKIDSSPEGTIRCKFWGLGSDGTVGANQSAIRIIGDSTDLYAQGYFEYDSKKSGGITISHLRFGPKPIHSTYLIDRSDFISCSNQAYVDKYDLLGGIVEGGTFLLNTLWEEDELEEHLPNSLKKKLAEKKVDFYTINASAIAQEIGLGGRINMVMQSAFFKLSEVIPEDLAMEKLRESIVTNYGRYGEDVVEMNYEALEKGISELKKVEVPKEWKDLEIEQLAIDSTRPDFVTNVADIMNRHEGDTLPVSAFLDHSDGSFPLGTSAYEKRGIALSVPEWKIENCIQCNQCSFVCPHAVIRPFLVNEEEKEKAPANFETKKAIGPGLEEVEYRIQISPLDCTGCGNCADICPSPKKALVMEPFEEQLEEQEENWNFAISEISDKSYLVDKKANVKNTQFSQPLMEFSGACAGCGETPYAKLITQLYGDHMLIANATGCTSIWGGSCPSNPYTKNHEGKGPAWANSLFEDNAEYGYGMALGVRKIRGQIENKMKEFLELELDSPLNNAFENWIEVRNDYEESTKASKEIVKLLEKEEERDGKAGRILSLIKREQDYLPYKSIWIFGGDGWAYDIGFGGLDHVLASGEDVNVFVFDTEVYSNTGGQASKSTQRAAVAQFAASGKRIRKKDLGLMMTTYGYVYVAQIAMGANYNQTLRAIKEAEAYDGPSLIIAYSPCISHGIKGGMGKSIDQMKKAVDAGYWHLYRNNPDLEKEGENPFILDSKEPTKSFREFIESEVRYRSLKRNFPEETEELFEACEEDARKRYENYLEKANRKY